MNPATPLALAFAGVRAADAEPAPADEPSDAGERRRLPTARVTAIRPAELPEDPSSFSTSPAVIRREPP